MGKSYQSALPEVFPWIMDIPESQVKAVSAILSKTRPGIPNGSSFAITSEAKSGYRRLWLSEISYKTIIDNPGLRLQDGTRNG